MNTQHDITVSGKPLNPPKPPAKPHMLLWIDTETTGISRTDAKILEIGMIVTSLDAAEEGGRFISPVRPDDVSLYDLDPYVLRMHLDNGLLDTVMETEPNEFNYANVARNLGEFIRDEASQYELHPAGTNVDYDIDVLTNQLGPHLHPDWLRQLTNHRKLDLSTYRISDLALDHNPYKGHAGTHRVEDCIRRDRNDYANSPKHYTDSHPGMECIDLTADTTFCLGNAIKYLWRYHSKGRPVEDLEKARWYLCRVIDYGEKIAWTQRQTRILTRLRGQAEANGLEHEYRIWRDLALGDTDTALANLDILLDHERNQQ